MVRGPQDSARKPEQIDDFHLKCIRNPDNGFEAGIPLPTFDPTDIRAIKIDSVGEALLRVASFFAGSPKVLAKIPNCEVVRHPP